MRFTQAQLREAVGISVETYRHWRTALPALWSQKGRAALFSFGDLVGLAVIRRIVEEFGVSVSAIAPASVRLFEECRNEAWLASEGRYAVISLSRRDSDESDRGPALSGALITESGLSRVLSAGAIVIAIGPIVESLRETLLHGDVLEVEDQPSLPFGPVPHRSRTQLLYRSSLSARRRAP